MHYKMLRNFAWLAFILFSMGCDDPEQDCCAGPRGVPLGQPFSIKSGEVVHVERSIITLTFDHLVIDSLCPSDVECVKKGTLKIAININKMEYFLSIGDDENPTVDFKNYTIELQKLVYPVTSVQKSSSHSTYSVQMLITKS